MLAFGTAFTSGVKLMMLSRLAACWSCIHFINEWLTNWHIFDTTQVQYLEDVSPVTATIVAASNNISSAVKRCHAMPGSLHRALGTNAPVISAGIVTVGLLQISHSPPATCYVDQGRSKLFKSAGDGCGLFVNNKNDQYNDRRVQKI